MVPQAEEEHPPTLVTTQCLHGGVVDQLPGFAQGVEVEVHPTWAEVDRFEEDFLLRDRPRIADGNSVVVPVGDHLAQALAQVVRGEGRPGRKLANLLGVR
jgi:hypothetical protein